MNPYTKGFQLVNFCLAPLTKSVECTSVSADDHQVDNLTSQHAHQRLKGFRVEHFIRPPVHLDFHFLAPVNIACVIIKPELTENSEINLTASAISGTPNTPQHQTALCGRGSVKGEGAVLVLKNRAFERRVHSKVDLSLSSSVLGSRITFSDTVKNSEVPFRDVPNIKCLKVTVNYFSGPRPVSLKWVEVWGTLGYSSRRGDIEAARAAIAHLSDSGGKGAVNVSTERPAGVAQHLKLCYDHKANCEMGKPCSDGTCTHIRALGKRVETNHFEMKKEKLPVSQYFPNRQPQPDSCRTYGTLSANSSTGTLKCSNHYGWHPVFSKYNSRATVQDEVLPEIETPSQSSHASTGDGGGVARRNNGGATDTVPERFLDEITYELMALPMLLPSGHFVDRSTLEKLQHTDSVYGRPPSDPFTGVAFSEHALPQFNVELKQQIDSFLSKHGPSISHGISSFGRTLGSAAEIVLHLSSIEKKSGKLLPEETRRKRAKSDVMSYLDDVHPPLAKRHMTTKTVGGEDSLSERETAALEMTSTRISPSPSSHHTATNTIEAGHRDRMCSQAHEMEVAASLDKELQDLLHR